MAELGGFLPFPIGVVWLSRPLRRIRTFALNEAAMT
jgi:hypothetical protein